jgi:hypothetical protein
MKSLMRGIALLFSVASTAQSPHLSILVEMDSATTNFARYKIEMKICKPGKMTERGSWFSHDTSTIDFASLKVNNIDCGEYFDKGMDEPLNYDKEEIPFNKFEFSGQLFAWEKIFVFKISNWSSRAWWPEMYIVLPVKYKSFITHIDFSGVEFQSGKVIFLSDVNASYKGSELYITRLLKNEKGVKVSGFPIKELLENK